MPIFYSYDVWLEKILHDIGQYDEKPSDRLLTAFEIFLIWQTIIAQDINQSISVLECVTQQAVAAFRYIKDWNIDVNHSSFHDHKNVVHFKKWLEQFVAYTKINRVTTVANAVEKIITSAHIVKQLVPSIYWIGFTVITSQQQQLMNCLTQIGISQHHLPTFTKTIAQTRKISLSNEFDEISAMAQWAQQASLHGSVACIVPKLQDKHRLINLIFARFIDEKNYQIITDIPFTEHAIVFAALQALSLNKDEIAVNQLSYLLRSPYFSLHNEEHRLKLLNQLQNYKKSTLTKHELLSLINNNQHFHQKITDFYNQRQDSPLKSIHDWSIIFINQLNILNFPEVLQLNAAEQRTINKFWNLLNQWGTTQTRSLYSCVAAIECLQQYYAQQPYAEFTKSPIVILDLLTAANMSFDQAWIMNIDHDTLFNSRTLNPLLPRELQQPILASHSKHFFNQYLHHYSKIIFSVSEHDNHHCLRQPNALLEHIAVTTLTELAITSPKEKKVVKLSPINDNYGPVLQQTEPHHGDTLLIKRQAQCPFRAFAEYRLHLRAPFNDEPGIPVYVQGKLIHECLELIWRTLQSQQQLLMLTDEQLQQLIARSVATSCEHHIDAQYPRAIVDVEVARLKKIISQWMTVEKKRQPFSVIACEQETHVTLNGFSINARIDRIDQLSNGQELIIDYKTSQYVDIKNCFDSRPLAPQLPLYAISRLSSRGIAYASINCYESFLHGIIDNHTEKVESTIRFIPLQELQITTRADDWHNQQTMWQITLTGLVQDYQNGYALVDPKDFTQCKDCHLQSLCRIKERQQFI